MNDYEQKCLDADKELAELLWPMQMQDVRDSKNNIVGRTGIWHPVRDDPKRPRWTQDDAAAFKLIVEYDASPLVGSSGVVVANTGGIIWYKDFPDKISCVRFAIVQSVINKLKEIK